MKTAPWHKPLKDYIRLGRKEFEEKYPCPSPVFLAGFYSVLLESALKLVPKEKLVESVKVGTANPALLSIRKGEYIWDEYHSMIEDDEWVSVANYCEKLLSETVALIPKEWLSLADVYEKGLGLR